MKLRVAGFVPESVVDGPGVRFSLFVQGCSHFCPGCHNPQAQDPAGGEEVALEEVLQRIKATRGISGVTFSGGEPFEQAAPLAALAREIAAQGLNLVLYSGYTFEELLKKCIDDINVYRLLKEGWILVDGPFILAQRSLKLPYRGSQNQRLLDLPPSLDSFRPVLWERKGAVSRA